EALLRSCRLARAGGAGLIALAPSGSALAQLATLTIPIDLVANSDQTSPISARLAYLVVIDVLALGLALRAKMQAAQADPRLGSLIA
ncbi:MAG: hypothetical protein H7Z39_20250, partial [Burkholderiaceae bacterium]|nr:hypothetical protein [Burkholderiaceae bacterium]